jgi:F0F1-type ATP synthase membrane subunit c/vacuolar-type H+-ATPase subunit K
MAILGFALTEAIALFTLMIVFLLKNEYKSSFYIFAKV